MTDFWLLKFNMRPARYFEFDMPALKDQAWKNFLKIAIFLTFSVKSNFGITSVLREQRYIIMTSSDNY